MCIGGEFLCLKSELKEIPVGYSALNQKSDVWYQNQNERTLTNVKVETVQEETTKISNA